MFEHDVRERTLHLELAWNLGDHDAVAQLFGADAWMTVDGSPHVLQGREAIHQWVQRAMDAHPRVHARMVDLFDAHTGRCSASTWIEWRFSHRCHPHQTLTCTSLSLWTRAPDGLRIRAHSLSHTQPTKGNPDD